MKTHGMEPWRRIRLLVYDFDGVMTDNRVYVSEDGEETVVCNRSDGLAVARLGALGYLQIVLSTEANRVVVHRANKLRIPVVSGCADKKLALQHHVRDLSLSLDHVAYVGNDVNDLEAMKLCGFKIAPADAHPSILALADHVTKARGGEGVIREVLDRLIENTAGHAEAPS